MTPILQARNVTFRQSGRQILHTVSLDVLPGQTLGIIGASGSGKSTLCRLLIGLIPPP